MNSFVFVICSDVSAVSTVEYISCPTLENLQARLEACGTADSCKSC